MRLMSQRTVLVRSCHRLSLLHFLWPPFPTTVQQVVQLQNAPALFCTLQVFSKIYFKLTYTQSLHYAVSFSAVSTSVVFDLGHQLISKAIYGLLTSPKKRMDELVLLAFLLFTANKSNSSVHFLGESTARQSAFRFYLTFSTCKAILTFFTHILGWLHGW